VLKKTITYKDFNDNEVSEDFFFHLSKAELVELEMSHDGGLSSAIQRIIDTEDNKRIIEEFKNIIMTAYGKRSEDGRRFIKNQELRDEFASTEAYSELFMELVTDTDAAVEFINGIIPQGMTEEAAKEAGIDPKTTPIIAVVDEDKDKEARILTKKEVEEMSPEELQQLGTRIQSGEVKLEEDS
jgi:hypothetical protein